MRDFAKVAPQFWTGRTGRLIRVAGRDAQVVALYLITCPSANMIGLYYLPIPTLCHEVGIPLQGASKALRRLSEAEFAHYDHASETVFVPEMARFQIGDTLQPGDNRVKGIAKELAAVGSSKFAKDFHDKYAAVYHLPPMVVREPLRRPLGGASEALRSQETETETEQEQEHASSSPHGDPSPSPLVSSNGHHTPEPARLTAEALVQLYNSTIPPGHPRVNELSDGRRDKAARYLKKFPKRDWWEKAFAAIAQSHFLTRGSKERPDFRGDFDWLLAKGQDGTENVVKVVEGRYRDHRGPVTAEDDDDDAT